MKFIEVVSMKHVINVLGLFLLLLGFVMAADTAWGWALMSVPIVYWAMSFLVLVHRSHFAAIVFWAALAYMNWQIAVVSISAYLVFSIVKAVIVHQQTPISKRYSTKKKSRTLGLGLDMKEDLYRIGD
ncbi:TPA: permease [Photobacterium damselae]